MLIESWIYQIGLQPRKATFDHFRKTLLVNNSWDVALQHGIGFGDLLLGFFLGIKFETRHADVGFRHLYTETSRQRPAFFFYNLTEDFLRVTTIVATGTGKISIRQGP